MQSVARSCVSRSRPFRPAFLFASIWLTAISANAILFYSTGDPNYNTTAPGGDLTDSGWQFEGIWGSFLGTPIAPKYFITAKHVPGKVGDPFFFQGVTYWATTVHDDPDSDLRICRICGAFPVYAPLYANTNEVASSLLVIGRGTQRGAPLTTTNLVLETVQTNGWRWGASDGVVRWGENVVAGIVNGDGVLDPGAGEFLQATFDAGAGANECHLSVGDSGGAAFIKDGAAWKLAGINYAVDGPYNTSTNGAGFDAAIFDERGLYLSNSDSGEWEPVSPLLPSPQPGSFYATRISAHLDWITRVLDAVAPSDSTPILQSSSNVSPPPPISYTDEPNAIVDDESRTVTIALPPGSRFYRLRACEPLTIQSIRVQDNNLVLTYR